MNLRLSTFLPIFTYSTPKVTGVAQESFQFSHINPRATRKELEETAESLLSISDICFSHHDISQRSVIINNIVDNLRDDKSTQTIVVKNEKGDLVAYIKGARPLTIDEKFPEHSLIIEKINEQKYKGRGIFHKTQALSCVGCEFAVDPKYRSMGIGKILVSRRIEDAKSRSAQLLVSSHLRSNQASERTLSSVGYESPSDDYVCNIGNKEYIVRIKFLN